MCEIEFTCLNVIVLYMKNLRLICVQVFDSVMISNNMIFFCVNKTNESRDIYAENIFR